MTIAQNDSGCSIKPAISVKPKTVSVNGRVISRDAIARETQNHPSTKPIEAWKAAARALAIRELLLQEAARLGVRAEPLSDEDGRRETDEEALVRQLVALEVRTPAADEATCRRYFEMNRSRFRSPDLFEVRHILIAADPGDKNARTQAAEQARFIIDELRSNPARFDALAEAASACPSGRTGGNLGQVGPGQTVPEFERALASAPIGEVTSEPVESRYGIHVLLVDRRIEGRDLPFELVQARIAEWLNEKVYRTALRQYIGILAGRAEISGIDIAADASPLVQ